MIAITKTSNGVINNILKKLYVKEFELNLTSVSQATQNGYKLIFDKEKYTIFRNGNINV